MINIKVLLVIILFVKVNVCYNQFQVIRHGIMGCLLLRLHLESGMAEVNFVRVEKATRSRGLMSYDDINKPSPRHKFIKQIVAVVKYESRTHPIGTGEIVATGFFFDDSHVLTSYNPFRELENKVEGSHMSVSYHKALCYASDKISGYLIEQVKLFCARRVILQSNITEGQWHGWEKKHSPLHDLMIIRTQIFENITEEEKSKCEGTPKPFELRKTKLAGPTHIMSDTLTFVSLGINDDYHTKKPKNMLHVVEIEREGGILQNCREWLPREWGYFICISNDNDYVGIGSGALLFSEGEVESGTRLIGVGSFALWKGNASILVFTDVRPYKKRIKQTCTHWDII